MTKYQILIEDETDGLITYECVLDDADGYMDELQEAGIYAVCCEITEDNMEMVFSMKSIVNKMKQLNKDGGTPC